MPACLIFNSEFRLFLLKAFTNSETARPLRCTNLNAVLPPNTLKKLSTQFEILKESPHLGDKGRRGTQALKMLKVITMCDLKGP